MKKRFVRIAGTLLMVMIGSAVFAQDPPPPPNGGHGQSGNQQPGGSAPIGGGIALLIGLAAMYGSKKVFDARKKLME